MDKNIDKKLKTLFEYQKFEDNPKLNQVIKDTLNGSDFKISELELSNVTGGNGSEYTLSKCPACQKENSLLTIFEGGRKYEHCLNVKCKYNNKSY